MRKRIMDLIIEIEDINYCIQQGAIDPLNLEYFKDFDIADSSFLMNEGDRLTTDAHEALENLMTMMKEREE